ncbi:MAG: Ribosomal RNA small subunit methyltransferase E (EC [uncultured Thiotrichaceae bacterium]|uniref:Ribosomal RNA small subunit methyltransferase E n=1 Tax=uncultured Thiotrichaceae bacterium TaxID=298394 RepID=A0A6S6SWC0_9GAMM|nr:MAG: Ribosomal RNA small subunit methyltransferase E (EC [uncultured Thiotrichaceae bacterium]
MRIPRFYQAEIFAVGDTVALSEENFRHAVKVMRLNVDEPIIMFNGVAGEYTARIANVAKRNAEISIESYDDIDRESPLNITLVLALIKPDKMDFAIQKAVELGVNNIQPVITERSVVKLKAERMKKKIQHWQGIIIAACEQSGRTAIPTIQTVANVDDYLQQPTAATRITMLPTSHKSVADISPAQNMELLVGPEGGFTDAEEAMFVNQQIQIINFGPRILRAETAVIAGLTTLQHLHGDV